MKTHQKILKSTLDERKKKNARYSLRSFSKFLDISPAQLSSLMNGRKQLTPKQASKIITKLQLDESDSANLMLDTLPNHTTQEDVTPDLKVLTADEFSVISDWFHFALLSLSRLKNNRAEPEWIAERLGIEPELAAQAFSRLQRLGLIAIEKGRFRQTSKPLNITAEIPSAAIRAYHRQNLRLAEDSIERVSMDKRILSSITMATTPEQIKKAEKKIVNFKHRLCKDLECSDPSEVYTLSLQLFPVTQIKD